MRIIFLWFIIGALSYNPVTNSYQNCVIMRVNGRGVTLWDIQKLTVVQLVINGVNPLPEVVEKSMQEQKENLVNFFLVRGELDVIQYKLPNKNEVIQTAREKLRSVGAVPYLGMYGISITSAAEIVYQIFRIRKYYDDFIFRVVDVGEREVREYYERNRNRFNAPFEEVQEKIKNFLVLEKKRKRLKDFINRLRKTQHLEIIYPQFECSVRR